MHMKLEELTLEQKIGLTLTARRFEEEDLEFIKELIHNHALACLQIPINSQSSERIRELQAEADYPLIFINDMERGYPLSGLPQLQAMTLMACDNPEYIRAYAKGIVSYAKKDGYSGTWNPVVDIYRLGVGSPPGRYWGDTPEKIVKYASEVAKVYAESGFIACAKHYPGGKDRAIDSHMAEAVSDVSREELIEIHLKPYVELMKQGLLPSIMSRHCVFRNIDPVYPATLSPTVIGLIREQGFDGVIFTDSLAMMGILQKYGEAGSMAMALNAGCDLLLPNYRTPCRDVYEMMMANYKEGKISEERLDEAVKRILTLLETVEANAAKTVSFTEEDRNTLESVISDCITAVTDEGVTAALNDAGKRRLFVVLTEMNFNEASSQEITSGKWYQPQKIATKIKEEFPNAEITYLPEFPSAAQNEQMLNLATEFEEVVFVTFTTHAAYQGPECLTRRIESVINALILSGKVKAIVHFGNPFCVENLSHVPRMIFGYSIAASMPFVFEILSGKRKAKGKLPYPVNLK